MTNRPTSRDLMLLVDERDEAKVKAMLDAAVSSTPPRKSMIHRLYCRYSKLRREREMRDLGILKEK